MVDVSCSLMVLVVVMNCLVVMRMVVVLKLGHLLHPIPLMILPIHHYMWTLMRSVLVHVESAMRYGGIRR